MRKYSTPQIEINPCTSSQPLNRQQDSIRIILNQIHNFNRHHKKFGPYPQKFSPQIYIDHKNDPGAHEIRSPDYLMKMKGPFIQSMFTLMTAPRLENVTPTGALNRSNMVG